MDVTEMPPDPFRHPKVNVTRGTPRENPAGLRQPSAYQFHGSLLALLLVLAGLAGILLPMLLDTTPQTLTSRVVDSYIDGNVLKVSVSVTNSTDTARTVNCTVRAVTSTGDALGSQLITTGELVAGDTQTLVAQFDTTGRPDNIKTVCN